MKCTWPTPEDPTPPIFLCKWGSRWLPDANEIYTKKRNLHGQRKKLASPNAKDTNMLVFLALGNAKVLSFALGNAKVLSFALGNAKVLSFALGNAKVLSFALGNAKVPNANDFAFWWSIGFTVHLPLTESET